MRLFIAFATTNNWIVHQLDINNVFFHDYIKEDIYILPPFGYSKVLADQVCILNKSSCGMKQVSRQLNKELSSFLIFKLENLFFIVTFVYVDDVLLTNNSLSLI